MIVQARQCVQTGSWLINTSAWAVTGSSGGRKFGRSREVLDAVLPAVPFSEGLRRSLCHYAAATAFTAAQALHIGRDRRVGVKAETGEIVSRQDALMLAAQAAHRHYAARVHLQSPQPHAQLPGTAK
jgi:hypothetical protein